MFSACLAERPSAAPSTRRLAAPRSPSASARRRPMRVGVTRYKAENACCTYGVEHAYMYYVGACRAVGSAGWRKTGESGGGGRPVHRYRGTPEVSRRMYRVARQCQWRPCRTGYSESCRCSAARRACPPEVETVRARAQRNALRTSESAATISPGNQLERAKRKHNTCRPAAHTASSGETTA